MTIKELVVSADQVPSWLAALVGSGVTAGIAKLIGAWKDYHSAKRHDERSDFQTVTNEYETLVRRLDSELTEVRRRITELEAKNAECAAQNAELRTENAGLRQEIAELRQRVDLLPKPRTRGK